MKCRHCHTPLEQQFLDLGAAPPSNAYLTKEDLSAPETWFPLRVSVCTSCWLAQTEDFADRETFFNEDYAYFSSMSQSWLAHAEAYSKAMMKRFALDDAAKVVEVASNDGYLLRNFQAAGVPNIGIEPTLACAEAARAIGIETFVEFFGKEYATELVAEGHAADLTAANNVLAHVPDINDFVSGFTTILKPTGVATFEFPHLLRQVQEKQFDTVYHEHFSYLSLTAVSTVFEANGLSVFDVEEIPTHGGSLRVFAQRSDSQTHTRTAAVDRVLKEEDDAGVSGIEFYDSFQSVAETIKDDFVRFLIDAKLRNKTVVAYGAAAKGNTLMNFAGIRGDLISYVVDRSPMKVGRYMPGSRIPITSEPKIQETRPDYVVILPWNIAEEVSTQLSYIRDWGGEFVIAVPEIRIF